MAEKLIAEAQARESAEGALKRVRKAAYHDAEAAWVKGNTNKTFADWKNLKTAEKHELIDAWIKANPGKYDAPPAKAPEAPDAQTLPKVETPREATNVKVHKEPDPIAKDPEVQALAQAKIAVAVAARGAKTFLHGTHPDAAVGIIREGLRPGSSVDLGGGMAESSPIIIEFDLIGTRPYPDTDPGGAGSAFTTEPAKQIKRVFFEGEEFIFADDARDAYARIRQALDESGYKDVQIEGMRFDEQTERLVKGGEVRFPAELDITKVDDKLLEQIRDRYLARWDALAGPDANQPRMGDRSLRRSMKGFGIPSSLTWLRPSSFFPWRFPLASFRQSDSIVSSTIWVPSGLFGNFSAGFLAGLSPHPGNGRAFRLPCPWNEIFCDGRFHDGGDRDGPHLAFDAPFDHSGHWRTRRPFT